jgi:hypothetical protein
MSVFAFVKRLIRDEDGGPLVEAAVMIPILITFLLGAVDFMNAFQQWSAAAKAVEVGARIAAVSDPVATGISYNANNPNDGSNTNIAVSAVSSSALLGSAMPNFQVTCDGGTAKCTCTAGTCTGMGSYSSAAMSLIVYGRDGKGKCGDATSEYFAGMCDIFPPILPKYVTVTYTQTGLGFAGRGLGAVPTISVSLNAGAAKLPFTFFFLPYATINIPSMTTTITGEALSSAAAD